LHQKIMGKNEGDCSWILLKRFMITPG